MGYFDSVTVSLLILCTANQETEGLQDRLTVQYKIRNLSFFYSALRARRPSVVLRAVRQLAVIDKIFKMANNKVDRGQLRDRSKIRRGGRAGAFLFWPTSFGETLPIPGAEKMLTPQNSLQNLSCPPHPTPPPPPEQRLPVL